MTFPNRKLHCLIYNLTGVAIAFGLSNASSANEMLSLDQVIETSLQNNFSYRIASLDPQIAQEGITRQEAAFDTEIFADGQISQSQRALPEFTTTPSSSDNRSWRAGVRKRLVYGTTLTAQTNLDRQASDAAAANFPLTQSADISISVRQPLMEGFGRDANQAAIERAKARFAASAEGVEEVVLAVLAQAELAYWQVSRWQEQLELNKSNLEVAENLLEEARERERVGMATRIEVLQAEAFRAESREQIIETTRELGDAHDQLLALMGTLPATGMGLNYFQIVQALGESSDFMPDFETAVQTAVERDPSLAAQSLLIEQRRWDQISARNALRPNLDLVVAGAYSGVDKNSATEAYNNTLDRDGHYWSIGVEFSMPWNNRQDKANLRIADKELDQEEIRYEELKQDLYQSVRSSWRALDAVRQSLVAAQLTVGLQQATFEREKSKYEQGLSAFRDVLEAQRDLDQARGRLLNAKLNRLSAEIELSRLMGTLFERNGISPILPELN